MRTVTKATILEQFLTKEEIEKALAIYKELDGTSRFAHEIEKEIIAPNIERINKDLGQENHPLYLAYLVEYAFRAQ